jgi:hypothetical protein
MDRELDQLDDWLVRAQKMFELTEPQPPAAAERFRDQADTIVAAIQTELRLARRASAFSG